MSRCVAFAEIARPEGEVGRLTAEAPLSLTSVLGFIDSTSASPVDYAVGGIELSARIVSTSPSCWPTTPCGFDAAALRSFRAGGHAGTAARRLPAPGKQPLNLMSALASNCLAKK